MRDERGNPPHVARERVGIGAGSLERKERRDRPRRIDAGGRSHPTVVHFGRASKKDIKKIRSKPECV